MSVAGTVRRKAHDSVEVTPRSGVWDKGRFIRSDERTLSVRGNMQPAPRDAIQRLPEGTRRDGAMMFYTLGVLSLANAPDTQSDLIRFEGVEYEVAGEQRWRNHRAYTLTRHGQ